MFKYDDNGNQHQIFDYTSLAGFGWQWIDENGKEIKGFVPKEHIKEDVYNKYLENLESKNME